jgi:hypothetical protein
MSDTGTGGSTVQTLPRLGSAAFLVVSWVVGAHHAPQDVQLGPAITAREPPPCRVDQLAAHTSIQPAAGSMAGGIIFTNHSRSACLLRGYPRIALYHHGQRLPVRYEALSRNVVRAYFGYIPKPFVLRSSRRAEVVVEWRSWCGSPVYAPVIIRIMLPGEHGYLAINTGTANPGQRVNPGLCGGPSEIQVWPFVPYPGHLAR